MSTPKKELSGRVIDSNLYMCRDTQGKPVYLAPFVHALFNQMESEKQALMHAAAGVSGEAGELLDAVKKNWAYNKPLDTTNVVEELGDIIFYVQAMMNMCDITWTEVLVGNYIKLSKRYQGLVYSDDAAIARKDKEESTKEEVKDIHKNKAKISMPVCLITVANLGYELKVNLHNPITKQITEYDSVNAAIQYCKNIGWIPRVAGLP